MSPGGKGVRKVPKKSHELLEWPLMTAAVIKFLPVCAINKSIPSKVV